MTVWTLAFPAQVWSGDSRDPAEPVMVNVLIESESPGEAARDLGDVLRALVRQAQVPSRTEIETSFKWPLHRLGLAPVAAREEPSSCPTCGLALAADGSCAYCLTADIRELGRHVARKDREPSPELDMAKCPDCGAADWKVWFGTNDSLRYARCICGLTWVQRKPGSWELVQELPTESNDPSPKMPEHGSGCVPVPASEQPSPDRQRCGDCRDFEHDTGKHGQCALHGHHVTRLQDPMRPEHDGEEYTGESVPCTDFRPVQRAPAEPSTGETSHEWPLHRLGLVPPELSPKEPTCGDCEHLAKEPHAGLSKLHLCGAIPNWAQWEHSPVNQARSGNHPCEHFSRSAKPEAKP